MVTSCESRLLEGNRDDAGATAKTKSVSAASRVHPRNHQPIMVMAKNAAMSACPTIRPSANRQAGFFMAK